MAKEVVPTGIGHNIIAQGTKIVGTITTNSDIRIDGELEGDLICKGKIVVGQQGNIKGNVDCANAEIMGNVNGKMVVNGTLSLKSTSFAGTTLSNNVSRLLKLRSCALNFTASINIEALLAAILLLYF